MDKDEIVKWLLTEAGEQDPLEFAASIIMKLALDTSWGYIRAVPYTEPPEKPVPPIEDPSIRS